MKKINIFIQKIKIFTRKIMNHQETAQIAVSGVLNP